MVRGIKNNNLGNIRKTADIWEGLCKTQTDPEFFQFQSIDYGLAAMAKILLRYQDIYGFNTITKIITRWAPPNENNTANYIVTIVKKTGIDANNPINLHDFATLKAIMKAMICVESDNFRVKDYDIDRGIALAGIVPPKKPLKQSGTLLGATTAIIGTTASKALELQGPIKEARDSLQPLTDTEAIKWVFVGLTLIGLLLIVCDCLITHKKRLT